MYMCVCVGMNLYGKFFIGKYLPCFVYILGFIFLMFSRLYSRHIQISRLYLHVVLLISIVTSKDEDRFREHHLKSTKTVCVFFPFTLYYLYN